MKGFRRIYRLRFLSALLLCLPGICLALWYAWTAFANFDRYRRAAGEDRSLTQEDFHIQLFDLLGRDLRRMGMKDVPNKSRVPHLSLHLDAKGMDTLLKGAEQESKRPYADAMLERGGQVQKIKIRLRGSQHWHLLGEKKSYKIKLPKGELFDGHRVFNLVNDPMPMKVGEQLVLDLVRDLGVLAPESSFVRLELNGKDLGLMHFLAQPDESVLRNNRRMPGSIYSGNLPSSAKTEELWRDAKRWKKVAWRNDEEKDSRADLERLLHMIHGSSVAEFVDFARQEINLEAFAAFDAVDVLFGGDQHDFRQNHKFYLDPYKGRWEPVAWSFRAFRHDPHFNLVENPLLLRLKSVPEYLSLRNGLLHRLLTHEASPTALRKRAVKLLKKLSAELASDPYWSAYKLLPRTDRFNRRMMRPMNLRRLAMVIESELTTYARRHDFLLDELRKNPLYIHPGQSKRTAQLLVAGRGGVQVTALSVRWPDGCEDRTWRAFFGEQSITDRTSAERAELPMRLDLYPGMRLVSREDANKKRGRVRAVPAPAAYLLRIESACEPQGIEVEGTHLVTQARLKARPAPAEILQDLEEESLNPGDKPRFEPGERFVHPERLRLPGALVVQLGPGDVKFDKTRVFGEQESVYVLPGTRFLLGAGASLIFRGRLTVSGSARRPVRIEAQGKAAWGGLVLQGPKTKGSSFRRLVALGGSQVGLEGKAYPGVINIHDTENIHIENCRFGCNLGSEDVLHMAYVKGLAISDTRVEHAAKDAFDLEFVDGKMNRIQVIRTGDEALDLMASRVEVTDSVLLACGGNAVSAGEESELRLQDVLIAKSKVGVLAKNASSVDLIQALLYRNNIGLRIYRRSVRYQGDSRVNADGLFVVGSEQTIKTDKESREGLIAGHLQIRLPHKGGLRQLMNNVLGLEGPEKLDAWLGAQLGEPAP